MTVGGLIGLVLLGAGMGFLTGLFGLESGLLVIPALLLFYQLTGVSSLVSTHLAMGTGLAIVALTSLASADTYRHSGHVIWKAVLYLGLAGVAGAVLGGLVAGPSEPRTLQRIFALIVCICAIHMLGTRRRPSKDLEPRLFPPRLLVTGFLIGLVSALSAFGGAVFAASVAYSTLHFPLKKALGTSSAAVAIAGLGGLAGFVASGWGSVLLPPYTLGFVGYVAVVPVVAGWIPLARLGAGIPEEVRMGFLRKVFVVILLVLAVKMFFF